MIARPQIDHEAYPRRLRRLSREALMYIAKDAQEALMAMPGGEKAGYYADEINYVSDELRRRDDEDARTSLQNRRGRR